MDSSMKRDPSPATGNGPSPSAVMGADFYQHQHPPPRIPAPSMQMPPPITPAHPNGIPSPHNNKRPSKLPPVKVKTAHRRGSIVDKARRKQQQHQRLNSPSRPLMMMNLPFPPNGNPGLPPPPFPDQNFPLSNPYHTFPAMGPPMPFPPQGSNPKLVSNEHVGRRNTNTLDHQHHLAFPSSASTTQPTIKPQGSPAHVPTPTLMPCASLSKAKQDDLAKKPAAGKRFLDGDTDEEDWHMEEEEEESLSSSIFDQKRLSQANMKTDDHDSTAMDGGEDEDKRQKRHSETEKTEDRPEMDDSRLFALLCKVTRVFDPRKDIITPEESNSCSPSMSTASNISDSEEANFSFSPNLLHASFDDDLNMLRPIHGAHSSGESSPSLGSFRRVRFASITTTMGSPETSILSSPGSLG